MKRLAAMMLLALTCTVWGPSPAVARGHEPSYLVLRAPARAAKGHAFHPGRGYEVRTHAYAYGWFGVQPRQHAWRSTGYNENYIQWSRQ